MKNILNNASNQQITYEISDQIQIKLSLIITMKREQSKQMFLQLNDFKSPICKETFDSLPKIYGSLKNKILKNKQKFYQMIGSQLQKKNKSRVKQKQRFKTDSQSNNKSQATEEVYRSLKSSKKHGSTKINYRKPRQFSSKFKNIKTEVEENKKLISNKMGKGDHESQHKVKFNTLHFLPTIRHPMMIVDKPETLSQIIDDKVYKSLAQSNPLIHLYKSKSPKSHIQSLNDEIKQEESEQQSPKGSPVRQYVPSHIARGIKRYGNQDSQKSNQGSGKQRTRTQYSGGLQQSYPVKPGGKFTEFSKRLTVNAFSDSSKFVRIGQNKKFHIPTKDEYKQFIQNYQPINPGFNLPKLIAKESFQIISYENAVYFGQYTTNIRKGYGLFITQDSVFEGIFDQDSKATGMQMTYDGIYTGHFKDNLRQGKGRFQWNNGQIYEGGWRDGKKNGFGLWKSNNGDSYEGQWLNGRQNGVGTHKHRTGTYKGQFKDCLKHGNGEQFFANGDHYKGLYEKGKPHGVGRYDWSDGSYYEGDFVNGYRDGKGQLYEKNGIHYKGSFRRDFKHGCGQEIQKSGQKFVGEFQNGSRVYTQPLKNASQ